MNMTDVLKEIASRTGMTYEETRRVYKAFVDVLAEALAEEEGVTLTGLGRFSIRKHKGHYVNYSDTKERIADYDVIHFGASRTFKQLLEEAKAPEDER